MKKTSFSSQKILVGTLVVVALGAGLYAANYLGWFGTKLAPGETKILNSQNNPENGVATNEEDEEVITYKVEPFVTGLNVPWSIVFTSPTRMLVTERPGRIRVIENGALVKTPLHTFSEVSTTGEEGLMSIAVDPEYEDNHLIYASIAYQSAKTKTKQVKIVRFKDEGSKAAEMQTIFDNIPAAQYHAGSRIKFGPDGKLYVTTGDATNKDLPQDKNSLGGKILRINADGSIPKDNPNPASAVWSYGHRNPQGIAWSQSGELYESEHGPSGFDGPGGGDEINRIVKDGNYGWPLVSHLKTLQGTIKPLVVYTPAEAPASLMVYSGKLFPQFKGNLFFGALAGQGLMRIQLDPKNPDSALSYTKLAEVKFGRIRDVTEGPDGTIYFSTSNKDGRGKPAASDDRIFKIVPAQK